MGLTVFDAGVLIGFLDANDIFHAPSRAALEGAVERKDRLVLPASAYAELLVGPMGAGTVETIDEALSDLAIEIEALDRSIAVHAARLRAAHKGRLKLPDAIVVATAMHMDANHVVTTDREWPVAKIDFDGTIHVL